MYIELKKWVTLGLTTAVLSTAVVACSSGEKSESGETVKDTAAAHGEAGEMKHAMSSGEGGEGEGEAGHDMDTLPVPHRLAFMSGHVQAGLALYRAGEAEMAAPHLLHPVSETHQAERAGLDTLGFTPDVFESVSQALEAGRPATEIEPLLMKAEANLKTMADAAGGDSADTIRFLMDTIVEEYTVAITDGAVSDPGEYQDAYGFAIVAKDHAKTRNNEVLVSEIDSLIALWPSAPIPPSDPTSVAEVTAKTSSVKLLLP